MPGNSEAEWNYCLSLDIIRSTAWGLQQTNANLDDFNRSFVEQAPPHLARLGLTDGVKFAGDGWNVFAEDKAVPCLCAFALIMLRKFRDEMAHATHRPKDGIPDLRLALAAGRDLTVSLFDGRKDWVGDSARNANRLMGYCLENESEILVMEAVHGLIERDFVLEEVDPASRPPPAKQPETPLRFKRLTDFKPEAATSANAHDCYVYALNVIGEVETAKRAAQHSTAEGRPLDAPAYHTLISHAPDYDAALEWLQTMRREGIAPDVVTYTSLMGRAPDYTTALGWLEAMRREDVAPNVVTYSTLISRAPDYDAALEWFEAMRRESVTPNMVTYGALVERAPDFETARHWIEQSESEGSSASVITLNSLFSKDLSSLPAGQLLDWYLERRYHPETPIQAAITSYRRAQQLDQALRLALDYAHLPAARKLVRRNPDAALDYFRKAHAHNARHPNAAYALGIAHKELRQWSQARRFLREALALATSPVRRAVIREWLRELPVAQ